MFRITVVFWVARSAKTPPAVVVYDCAVGIREKNQRFDKTKAMLCLKCTSPSENAISLRGQLRFLPTAVVPVQRVGLRTVVFSAFLMLGGLGVGIRGLPNTEPHTLSGSQSS